jgi:hypothetical protein
MADKVAWSIKVSYIESCSCDYGCPCNFSGFPTKGFCHGAIGIKIEQGSYGETKLDGVTILGVVKWPGAIHEGNGVGAMFIDDKTNDDQRAALGAILSGEAGGMPWELISATVSEMKGPFFAPVKFEDKGSNSKVTTTGVEIQLESFKNPVTGEAHEVHTVIPGGFIWTDGQVCNSARNVVKADGIEWDYSGQSGYYAKVEWSNAESHAGAATKFEH